MDFQYLNDIEWWLSSLIAGLILLFLGYPLTRYLDKTWLRYQSKTAEKKSANSINDNEIVSFLSKNSNERLIYSNLITSKEVRKSTMMTVAVFQLIMCAIFLSIRQNIADSKEGLGTIVLSSVIWMQLILGLFGVLRFYVSGNNISRMHSILRRSDPALTKEQ